MQHSKFKELLEKYERGAATKAEQYVVERWYDSFDSDQIESIPGIETEQAALDTRSRIRYRAISRPATKLWYKKSWFRIAASVILVSTMLATMFLQRTTTVPKQAKPQFIQVFSTGKKQIKKILLQDSTVVWLNANSNLRLSPAFGQQQRLVALTGEAFFEVKENPNLPFLIDASPVKVTVLGTSFNVCAYPSLHHIKISVNTGKVQVKDGRQKLTLLSAGSGMSYNKATGLTKLKNSSNENSWTAGKITLEKASFQELAQNILNLYDLNLITSNKQVRSFKYNLTLQSGQSAEKALETITSILNKRYKKEGKNDIIIY